MYVADILVPEQCHTLVVVGFLFTCLASVFVLLRVITRVWFVRSVGLDDGFIVLSNLGTLGFLVAVMEQVRYGLGLPPDPKRLSPFIQATTASVISYTICHLAVKLSISFQCLRIFITPTARNLFIGLIVFFSVYGTLCLMLTIFTCYPVAKYWDDSIPGKCLDNRAMRYAFAGINIINDITLLVAPMPFLRNLQIARRIKFILMGVFAAGVVSNKISKTITVKGIDIAIWSGLECNIAIICACVPSLKPLFSRVFPSFIASLHSSKTHPTDNQYAHGSSHTYNNISSYPHDRSRTHRGVDTEITVQQSFEMRATITSDDNLSEKNLVTVNTAQYRTKRASHQTPG
ncbi:uncharacterized protein QYS62_007911 [Fusarium acuminatum]|uniref:Rhodopsin domain-containing protein n=1 Tax=Fusarium acuminatum TaxID=5515 RepID=A0ABZ2X166_9HYPO